MWQGCRPAGRLFYLVLTVMASASNFGASAHGGVSRAEAPTATSSPAAKPTAEAAPRAASPTPQSGPNLTSVIDTVYLASGAPAAGTLVITWPAFTTASGTGVAPGELDVTLGTGGALDVQLIPNVGATPAGVYYSVVYQLQPNEVRTEYWLVPTTSPVTLAQVRTTPGSGTAAQPVSMQYVNTQLALKANDDAVVHLANAETITGVKSFTVPPNVPTPVDSGDVANKSYVDNAVGNVGAGNFLPTAGGTMTGPLTLSGEPTAPLQAAAKEYVDENVTTKADLVSGLVPTSELGSGTASSLNCLLGNGTWGPCGSSANATAIQSVSVASSSPTNGQVLTYSSSTGQYAPLTPSGAAGGVVTGPSASQNITQPVGTQLSVNDLSGIRYVTETDNWNVSPGGSLVGGTQATVTLTPCPVGIDTSGNSMYYVCISGQGTPEAVMVTGGTCTSGASTGTVVFTPKNTHSATYVLGSASTGIQEAINDACGVPNGSGGNPNARVILPATGSTSNALPVYGSIFGHCSRTLIEGNGTLLSCSTRDRCMVLGDLVNSNHYGAVTLRGVNLTSTVTSDGCQITNTQRQSNVVTITVASGCSTIQTGDLVNINFTDSPSYWGSHGPVTVSGTSITYNQTGANIASAGSPGTIAIQNAAIEDNALPGTMEDIKYSSSGGGKFNQFFVVDNDQAATIRNFDNGANSLLCTANHCGSFVYSAGTTASTPVLWLDKLNISAQCGGNGVTVYANNTTHINDSVIQGFGMWGVYTSTILGSFGGTQLDNVYNEEGAGPCTNPYLGSTFSAAGIIYSGGAPLTVRGGEQPNGWMPEFADTGSTQYDYYVVVHDSSGGTSYPLFAGYALSNGSGSVTVQWPHVPPLGTVTYDVIRMTPSTLGANGAIFPEQGECGGGSTTACGSVATSLAQCSGLVCTYTDNAAASTASYTIATPGWFPTLNFWPGGLVINGIGTQNAGNLASAFLDTDQGSTNTSAWISVAGFVRPTIYARQCSGGPPSYGGAWVQCLEGDSHGNGFPEVGALLLNSGPNSGAQTAGVKGRLNFAMSPGASINQSHIITLVDSNPAKTFATMLNRPPNDAADTYIGLDQGNTTRNLAQLAFGSPVAISSYIGNTGDNASYLERLTASAKTFNVPVTVNGNLTVTGTCTGCGGGGSGSGTVNSGTIQQLAMYAANGAAVSGDTNLTDSGTTLNYAGSSGISAAAGTFSGNVMVNGQLLVAGPWTVSSPIPGTAMGPASAGTSALGISSDGNFYISANAGTPQKVATTATSSYFSNLFQEDANDIGEYNPSSATTAQGLHVYSIYTNSSSWQRTTVGFDPTDNYAVLRSENSTAGDAPGLGFWINNGLKWVIDASSFVIPALNARVTLIKADGGLVFTGYVTVTPQYEYLGWGEQAPVYRYNVMVQSDEVLLDQKALPNRPPFVNRSAGNAINQLAQDLLPGYFDTSAVQGLDTLPVYAVNPQKSFSFHAAEIALSTRASFRAMNGALTLAPVGTATYTLNESDENFSPSGLSLNSPNMLVNEVTVIGGDEPQAYVRDYFVGDGESLKFYLSQTPFAQAKPALIDEEYLGPGLDPTTWTINGPSSAISVVAQTLQVAGGPGVDGQTTVSFIEQIELGGALELQHGDVSFTAASQGVIGGLYAGAVSVANCLAGFQITPSDGNSTIQALVDGAVTGTPMTTTPGHQYFFTTYLYSIEVYRSGQTYHSSLHPAGSGWGAAAVPADVRFVLEVQDIDPSNLETLVAPATVLYDDVISNAPGFCTYALVDSISMQCSIAYTYVSHITLPEVRTALPDASYITQLVGPLSDGAECEITSDPSLDFYPEYVPALNQLIVASYRGSGRAVALVENAASVSSLQNGADDGTRGSVRVVKTPEARTDVDCENAALAILDNSLGTAWSGAYETWSDFLPGGAADIFPGDAIALNVPSRGAAFTAIVREVQIEVVDPADDRGFYTIVFANDLQTPLAIEFGGSAITVELQDAPTLQETTQVGSYYQQNLTAAQITSVTSTTISVDIGMAVPDGYGVEVRENDYGWGQANDRNLLGRFNTETFTLTRLAEVQDYFLRLYDNESPPRYSRYSAALHVDYPL